MDPQTISTLVKDLGFPIAVGVTMLSVVVGMGWYLLRSFIKQLETQQMDLAEQRKVDRELTKEVVQHISTSGVHLKNISDYMAGSLQQSRDNMVRQDERHMANVQTLSKLSSNQEIMMAQFNSFFQGLGDARQSIQIADSSDRQKKKASMA